jgi:macrolide transport system ATP-binding/permease protein
LPPARFGAREALAHVQQAARALAANKVRALLSMLGVLIGVAAVIAMLALGQGAQQAIEQQLASLGSNLLVLRPGASQQHGIMLEAGATTRLRAEDGAALQEVPEVSRVAPSVQGMAQAAYNGRNWRTRVIGTTPAYAGMRAAQPTVGRFLTEQEEHSRARVAVIGMTLVRELFQGANPIGEIIKVNRVSFQVIGILPEKGATAWRDEDDQMIIPLSTAMRRLLGRDYVDSIDIEVRSAEAMAPAQTNITTVMRARNRLQPHQSDGFTIRNMAEIQSALTATSKTMSMLLAVIATISLVVGGIGIMNIMLVSVTERTREIGIRKAIGARRRDILGQFLIEAVAVSMTGGALGILLGWGITVAMARLAGWTTAMSAESVGMAFFFSAGVGVVFGLWPALKASRLNPIEALRYE